MKKTSLGCILLIVEIVAVMIVSFSLIALLDFLQRKLLIGGDSWMFYEPMPYAEKLLIIPLVVLLMELVMAVTYKLTGAGYAESANSFVRFIGKHKLPVAILCVILLYVGFTGISVASEDSVTVFSAINPGGRTYELELVSSVDTGFNKRGDFYYNINVDGKTLKFSAPTANYEKYPEYEKETYKEFADFDAKLMAAGAVKNADTASLENAYYDESCMKYLREVVK